VSHADARHGALLAVLLAPLSMTQADATIVNVANPSIHADLHTSGAELELVISAYLLCFAMLLITGARLGEMRGYRRLFMFGLGTFTLASLACGVAPNPVALIVGRSIQGVGAALIVPQVLTGIQRSFKGHERVRALGLYAAALAGGSVTGQILGGLLVSADLFGARWRPIFLINVPIGVAVMIAGRRLLSRDGAADTSTPVDLMGVTLLSGALLLIVLPLTLGSQENWPPWAWGCLIASIPCLAAFGFAERRVAARGGLPLVNLPILARPAIAWGLCPQAAVVSTYYALLFTLPLYLQRGLGRSPLTSGLTLVPLLIAFGVAGPLVGRQPRRLRPELATWGALLLALAYFAISIETFAGQHAEALLVVWLGIGGFGLGTMFTVMLDHLTTHATPRYASDISGVFTTSLQVAGAIGVGTFGTVYLDLVVHPGPSQASHAFAIITATYGGVGLLAAAMAYRATRTPRPQSPS
jgi:MFS family permease